MTTDPIAAARAVLENDLSIMLLCETCPEECNCYPPADMWRRRDNGDLICEGCAETADMPAEDLDLAPRPADVIRALLVALEAERAKVAAAYEAAAGVCALMAEQVADAAITGLPEQARLRESMEAAYTKATWRIRTLTPADAEAALDKLLAEARLDEQERCVRAVETARDQQRQAWLEGRAVDLDFARMVIAHIRDRPEPKEANHE